MIGLLMVTLIAALAAGYLIGQAHWRFDVQILAIEEQALADCLKTLRALLHAAGRLDHGQAQDALQLAACIQQRRQRFYRRVQFRIADTETEDRGPGHA